MLFCGVFADDCAVHSVGPDESCEGAFGITNQQFGSAADTSAGNESTVPFSVQGLRFRSGLIVLDVSLFVCCLPRVVCAFAPNKGTSTCLPVNSPICEDIRSVTDPEWGMSCQIGPVVLFCKI